MAHIHVARRFLGWFAQEAVDTAEEGGVIYAPGTDFVLRYRNANTGVMENAVDYVGKLAMQRLAVADADKVVEEAKRLLSQ